MTAATQTTSRETPSPDSVERGAGKARRRISAIVCLFLVYLALDRAIFWVVWRTPGHSLIGRALRDQDYLAHHPEARRLLIIGDSRVKWTMDPRVLTPAVGLPDGSGLNIALPNTVTADDLAVLHWLRSEGYAKDVKVIVWGMGLDRFRVLKGSKETKIVQFCDEDVYRFYQPMARGFTYDGVTEWTTRWVTPAISAHVALQGEFGDLATARRALQQLRSYDAVKDYAELGYLANEHTADSNPGFGEGFATQEVRPEHVKGLVGAVEALRRDGVRVVIVDTPVSRKLLTYFKDKRSEAWAGYCGLLSQLEKAGAEVYRGNDLGYTPEMFSDPVHMTGPAAEGYVKDLCGKLARKP